MSVKINNVDLESCSYNGNEVTEILVNGIQVWQKSSPAIEPAIFTPNNGDPAVCKEVYYGSN